MNIQDTHRLLITLTGDERFRVNARSDYAGAEVLLQVEELEITTYGHTPQGVKLRISGMKVRKDGTAGQVYTTCTEWTQHDAGQALWKDFPYAVRKAVRDAGIRV